MTQRVAVVTGAGTGVGKAAAYALLDIGYSVVFVGRRKAVLEQAIAESPRQDKAISVAGDVSVPEDVKSIFEGVKKKYGRLDLLFNNAGVVAPSVPFEDLTLEAWRNVVDVNLTATFLCSQEAVRMMKNQQPRGGRIINNGSVSAHAPRPRSAAYTATKHAITGLTKSISLDNREFDICCSQIDIGNASTDMTVNMPVGVSQPDGSVKCEAVMDAENVGKAVAYIASLSREANVLFMTVMANQMPFVGRG